MKLRLEDVTVDSFPTGEILNDAGTVHAFAGDAIFTNRPIRSCPECNPPVLGEPPAE
jgi:hypothetical protein